MKARFLAVSCLMCAVLGFGLVSAAGGGEKADMGARHSAVIPQLAVVCTGWHALCSGSTDCQVNGEGVDCDCWRVNETHIVEMSEIQNIRVKRLTEARCTNRHPCDVDEAPVCAAIKDGRHEVEGINYPGSRRFLIADGVASTSRRPVIQPQTVMLVISTGPSATPHPARKRRIHPTRIGLCAASAA
jgi:hypothetical protein